MLPIFIINNKCISEGNMSSNIISSVVDVGEVGGYCVHAVYTGSPNGTLTIEASNNGINFYVVNSISIPTANSQLFYQVDKAHYKYVRVVYTASSGSGTLNCQISGKQI
jgi:hypothetical protein